MTTENSAVVKIVAQKTKEYNELLEKSNNKLKEYRDLLTDHKKLGHKFMFLKKRHETLMEVHAKTLKNEYNQTERCEEQRREIVEDLTELGNSMNDGDEPYDIVILKEKWGGKK